MASTLQSVATSPPRREAAVSSAAGPRLGLELDLFRVSMSLLIIISVSRVHQHFSVLSAMRPGVLLVVLAGAGAVLRPKSVSAESLLSTKPAKLMALFGILACVSIPFGISIGNSARFIISDYSKTLVFGFLLIMGIRGVRDLYTFAWAYIAGMGVLMWMAMFWFKLSSLGSKAERLGRLYSWDGNDVGVLLLVGLGLTLLTLQTSGKLGRIASVVALVGIGVTIGRTGSRGALLGFVVTGGALLILLKSISVMKRAGFVVAVVAALVAFAPPGYWEQMRTMMQPKEDYNWSSTDGRRQVWMRGLGYMLDHPVFGLGIHNFQKAECFISDKSREAISGTYLRCTAPHNSYLEAGAELGIPGLMLWCVLVFGGISGMLKLRRRLPAAWARGSPEERFLYLAPLYLAISMIGFSVSSIFVGFAWLEPVYYLAAMMAGVYVVVRRDLPRGPHAIQAPASHPGRRAAPIAVRKRLRG